MKRISTVLLVLVFFLSGCGKEEISPTASEIATAPSTVTPYPSFTSTPVPTETTTLLPEPVFYTNPQEYQVEYSVRVANGSFMLTDLRLYQPRLVEWDSQKNVQEVSVSPAASQVSTDPVYGNGIYFWKLAGQPKPGEYTDFIFQTKLKVYEILTQIKPDEISPYNVTDPIYILYTRPEQFIESDNTLIVELASQVAGEEQNPYRMARKFYDYIIQTMRFHNTEGLQGALSAAQEKRGEAGDYAALFVALCRAKGIPARPVVGYSARSGLDQANVWAEFYVEPFGWIPVDILMGQHQASLQNYYFGNLDNNRIIINKGYNIPLVPAAPDNFEAAYLQVPFYWFWGSSGDNSTVILTQNNWTVQNIP